MKRLEYYNVKEYKSIEDKEACEKAWDNGIELTVDENGKVLMKVDNI